MFQGGNSVALVSRSTELAAQDYAWLYGLSGIIGTIGCAIAAGTLLIGALLRGSMPPLPALGAGLAIAGLGFFVRAFAGSQLGVIGLGVVLTTFGDLAIPIGTAYAALGRALHRTWFDPPPA